MALSVPSAICEEGRHIGHDEAQPVQDRPCDDDTFEPCTALVYGAAAAGEVHHQQCHRRGDNGGNGGDKKNLVIDILHDLVGFLPDGGGEDRLTKHRGHGHAREGRI